MIARKGTEIVRADGKKKIDEEKEDQLELETTTEIPAPEEGRKKRSRLVRDEGIEKEEEEEEEEEAQEENELVALMVDEEELSEVEASLLELEKTFSAMEKDIAKAEEVVAALEVGDIQRQSIEWGETNKNKKTEDEEKTAE